MTLVVAAAVACGAGYHVAISAAGPRTTIVVKVQRYGAVGDGRHDDSRAVQDAISSAAAHPGSTVYLPRGVYYCPKPIRLTSHVKLRGDGSSASWLMGHLDFGSRCKVSRLKIGATGIIACTNQPNATHTTFTRVRLRGGGATWAPVIRLGGTRGSHNSCSFITFKYCEVERNLGDETNPPSKDLNDITLFGSYLSGEAVVHDITFDHCHVGVSNGQGGWDVGSPYMGIEVWPDFTNGSGGHLSVSQAGQKPWYNVTVTNCVFEATDWSVLDFSDQLTCDNEGQFAHSATGAVVSGNVLHGAGHRWPTGMGRITFEGPCDSVCADNTIYQGSALGDAIQVRDWETSDVTLSHNTLRKGYGP